MKTIYLALTAVFFTTSCSHLAHLNSIAYDEPYEISVNTTSKTIDNRYVIKFDSVLNESRCPKGVECVWQGYAKVRFILTDSTRPKQSRSVELYTLKRGDMNDEAIFNHLKIKLLLLSPYPSVKSEIQHSKYRAKIIISKMN